MAGFGEELKIISEFVQKQMSVLGPNIALDTARKVVGLKFSEDGSVLALAGDFPMVMKALAHEFTALSEALTHITLEGLRKKYPQTSGF